MTEGPDVEAIVNRYRSSLMNFEQLQDVPDPSWLIKDVLLQRSVNILWGDSGAGKSFLALDWSMSIATGKPTWFGHAVSQAKVLYILGEGKSGMKIRANAWAARHQAIPEEEDMTWMGQMVDFISPATFEAAKQIIGEEQPRLIVIDTLARAFTGHNENDTTDMGRFVANAEEIRDTFNASVLGIHHPNNGAIKKMRGNGALKGAIDGEYELEMSDPEITHSSRTLYCRKLKDAPRFPPKAIYLREVRDSLVPMPTQFDSRAA